MLNKIMLIGNLGADPEVRYTENGNQIATFSLATSERWTDKQGQKQERTEWHSVVAWDRLADLVQKFLKKGSRVYVEGKIQTRGWETDAGEKRFKTEVQARLINFLDPRDSQSSQSDAPARNEQGDDLPF